MEHLRHAGQTATEQQNALELIIRNEPVLMDVLTGLCDLDLPDWLLVSGAIYNSVWNSLTGRAPMTGVKDIDVFYFDDRDLSYEAEDVVIKQVEKQFSYLSLPVEARNQARVHLWAPEKFGVEFQPLISSEEMLQRFASKTHAVGARLDANGHLNITAPFGLDDIFSFQVVPNHAMANQVAHDSKGARAKTIWPELTVNAW